MYSGWCLRRRGGPDQVHGNPSHAASQLRNALPGQKPGDIATLAAILGHADIGTTTRYLPPVRSRCGGWWKRCNRGELPPRSSQVCDRRPMDETGRQLLGAATQLKLAGGQIADLAGSERIRPAHIAEAIHVGRGGSVQVVPPVSESTPTMRQGVGLTGVYTFLQHVRMTLRHCILEGRIGPSPCPGVSCPLAGRVGSRGSRTATGHSGRSLAHVECDPASSRLPWALIFNAQSEDEASRMAASARLKADLA